MDPRDELHHSELPVVLYTELGAECDQQATMVGRSVIAKCSQQQMDDTGLFMAFRDGECAVAIFF